MAYMNQERKARIAKLLQAIPEIKDWKYSLSVRHGSTIVMTVRQAPVDLLAGYRRAQPDQIVTYANVNGYYYQDAFEEPVKSVIGKVYDALNLRGEQGANHNNSDIQTDYFDVGWYVDLYIGKWDDPFVDVLPQPKKPKGLSKAAFQKKVGVPDTDWAIYLPVGWANLTPGKKAHATKVAKAKAGY